jgi:hypothetical protein
MHSSSFSSSSSSYSCRFIIALVTIYESTSSFAVTCTPPLRRTAIQMCPRRTARQPLHIAIPPLPLPGPYFRACTDTILTYVSVPALALPHSAQALSSPLFVLAPLPVHIHLICFDSTTTAHHHPTSFGTPIRNETLPVLDLFFPISLAKTFLDRFRPRTGLTTLDHRSQADQSRSDF